MRTSVPRVARLLMTFLALAGISRLVLSSAHAACPPGEALPITSGAAKGHPPVVSNLGGGPTGSYFVLGAAGVSSGSLPASLWLVNLGDRDGDGLPEYRIEAPAGAPGGWNDPRAEGCPAALNPPRPPLVIQLHHDREDLDGDGRFDIFEDLNRNGRLDPGEDRDGDGRMTPPDGCEGVLREDVDCDGHIDLFYEDVNGNGVLDSGEDIDGDRRLDLISEDRDADGILDPGEDLNENGRLDVGPYTEDRNHNQILDDRTIVGPDDRMSEFLPDGTEVPIASWYPYGSFVPAPGGFFAALVAWNGSAYDLSGMNSSTRLSGTPEDVTKRLSGR